jgi:hypothetical protein
MPGKMRLVLPVAAATLAFLVAGPAASAGTQAATRPGFSLSGATAGGKSRPANSSAPGPCFTAGLTNCSSADPVVTFDAYGIGDSSSCTFQEVINWGDGASRAYQYAGGPAGAKLATITHSYAKGAFKAYAITATPATLTGTCTSAGAALRFTLLACAPGTQPSGPAWVAKFPGSKAVSALAPAFRTDVSRFLAAMKSAKIRAQAIATLRPPQRAYLMHWSWLIAKGKVKPGSVPAFAPAGNQAPVNVCWIHPKSGRVDETASVEAARRLVAAYGIDPTLTVAPAASSRHTQGLAIDLATTWTARKVTIKAGNGHLIKIGSSPRTSLNPLLIKVGKTYGVIHYLDPPADASHWSSDGH